MITPEIINSAIESFKPIPVRKAYQIRVNGVFVKTTTGKIVWRTKAGARLGIHHHFAYNSNLLDLLGPMANIPKPPQSLQYDWNFYDKVIKSGIIKETINELLNKKIIEIVEVQTNIPF